MSDDNDFFAQIKELAKAIEEMDRLTHSFFDKVIDFLKWTTAIAIGSLALIGNIGLSHMNNEVAYFLLLTTILCLFESILWALYTFKRVIDIVFSEWKISFAVHKWKLDTVEARMAKERTIIDDIVIKLSDVCNEYRDSIVGFLNLSKIEPDFYERNIIFHLGLLISGLMFFVLWITYLGYTP
jgi:hypothetical protein